MTEPLARIKLDVPGRLNAELSLAADRVTAVVGNNGAGKSTLLHAIAGVCAAEGSVRIRDAEWLPQPMHQRDVALMHQQRKLFPHLTALDNVAFGLRHRRGLGRSPAREEAGRWLERMQVAEFAQRRPDELSGGQAQRVAMAQAMATTPTLLLLDEPFTSLDMEVADALRRDLLAALAEQPATVLLVTHDSLDISQLADEVVALETGRVVQHGTADDVAAHPGSGYVARLVGRNIRRTPDATWSFTPDEVTLSLRKPESSARLQWPGTVRSIDRPHGAAHERVRLVVAAGSDTRVDITPEALRELGIQPGSEVWLSVKSSAARRHAHPG